MPSSGKSAKSRLPKRTAVPEDVAVAPPGRVARVDDEPARAVGLEPALGLDQLRFLDHAATLYASALGCAGVRESVRSGRLRGARRARDAAVQARAARARAQRAGLRRLDVLGRAHPREPRLREQPLAARDDPRGEPARPRGARAATSRTAPASRTRSSRRRRRDRLRLHLPGPGGSPRRAGAFLGAGRPRRAGRCPCGARCPPGSPPTGRSRASSTSSARRFRAGRARARGPRPAPRRSRRRRGGGCPSLDRS